MASPLLCETRSRFDLYIGSFFCRSSRYLSDMVRSEKMNQLQHFFPFYLCCSPVIPQPIHGEYGSFEAFSQFGGAELLAKKYNLSREATNNSVRNSSRTFQTWILPFTSFTRASEKLLIRPSAHQGSPDRAGLMQSQERIVHLVDYPMFPA